MHTSYSVTLNNKGQITIPAAVRRELGLSAGMELSYFSDSNGDLVLKPKRALKEILKNFPKPLSANKFSISEENKIANAAVSEHVMSSLVSNVPSYVDDAMYDVEVKESNK